jgi:hypothetical protein
MAAHPMHVHADGCWQAPNYMNSHKNRTLRSTRRGDALTRSQPRRTRAVACAQYVPVSLQHWSSLHRCQLRAASVCEKSGEAGAVDMEAAGLSRNIQWRGRFPTVSEQLRSGALSCRRPVLPCIPLIGTAYSPLRLLRHGLPIPSRTQATTLARRCSAATPRFASADQGRLCESRFAGGM